jgi:hypothetical protein
MPRKTSNNLPTGVIASDTEYPRAGRRIDLIGCVLVKFSDGDVKWVVRTLNIARGRTSERSYAMGVDDGKVYRVGNGPHVLKEIAVHVTEENKARLALLIQRKAEGEEAAGQIRDRISTRRAQGQLHRAAGRRSWTW